MALTPLLYLPKFLDALVLFMITGIQLESLIHEQSSASSWDTHQLRRDIGVGAQLRKGDQTEGEENISSGEENRSPTTEELEEMIIIHPVRKALLYQGSLLLILQEKEVMLRKRKG